MSLAWLSCGILISDDDSGDGVGDMWDCTYLVRATKGTPG
jgi:hypothetical protein